MYNNGMKKDREKGKFFTERDKTLLKLFFFVFLVLVVALNWNNLSWVLNIRTAPRIIEQKLEDIFSGEEDEVVEEEDEKEEEEIDPAVYCEENKITISAIEISAPVVETGGTSEQEYRDSLDRGVVHFPGSVYPGEEGLTVLLGHSAPLGTRDPFYYQIFTEIDKLQEGDEIEVCYNNRLTTYTVIDEERGKKVYEVGEDVPPLYPEEDKKEIVLMTCWPPGDSEGRIGVRGIER